MLHKSAFKLNTEIYGESQFGTGLICYKLGHDHFRLGNLQEALYVFRFHTAANLLYYDFISLLPYRHSPVTFSIRSISTNVPNLEDMSGRLFKSTTLLKSN